MEGDYTIKSDTTPLAPKEAPLTFENKLWHAFYIAEFNCRYHEATYDQDNVLADWEIVKESCIKISKDITMQTQSNLDILYDYKWDIEKREQTKPNRAIMRQIQQDMNEDIRAGKLSL